MDGGLPMIVLLKDTNIDTDISVILSYCLDVRFWRPWPILAMAAPSTGVGRGDFKLKNKMKHNVYSKIKHHQAILDIRIKIM